MSVFAYTAIAKNGRRTNGTLNADTRAAAIAQVMQQGLHPVTMDEQRNGNGHVAAAKAAKVAANTPSARAGRVSQKAVEGFTRELANLLSGGVPLSRALSLLQREATNPAAKHVWTSIHDDVVGGTALAESMAKWPKAFSGVYIAMVRAGEAGGFLEVVLAQITDFRTREQDLKGKVKAAMVYPIALASLATLVLIGMLTWFIPRFTGIFADFGANLPALTLGIIAVSNVVKHYLLFVVIAIVVGVIFLRRALATDTGRRRMEKTLLATPLLGRVISHFALVRFARMLGTLIGSGVPLVASLRTAREAIGNQTLADTVTYAIEQVQRGEPLSKALGNSPQLFPPSVIETIAVAEETGKLDKELVRLATAYEADLDRQLRMLVAAAEPLLLFLMAGVIGTVVVGMLLPIFNLQDVVK
jgi:type II secretory pathway component PulF